MSNRVGPHGAHPVARRGCAAEAARQLAAGARDEAIRLQAAVDEQASIVAEMRQSLRAPRDGHSAV